MTRFLSLLAVVLGLGLTAMSFDAEAAKRLGGGKSTGMQRQSVTADKSPAAPAAAAAATPAAGAAGAAGAAAKPSWMGPVAGLAAGLGLAALASYLGFGEALANGLMIALLVMVALAVVGLLMRKRGGAQPALAGAGAPAGHIDPTGQMHRDALQPRQPEPPVAREASPAPRGSMIGANIGGTPRAALPADFDVAGFERQAKLQFIRLQAANDAGKLDDIREFTTPEMYAEIRLQIAERGTAAQRVEVVSVDARVLEVLEEDARYVVSVRYTGVIREDAQGAAEGFDEVWHLTKPRQGQGGWVIAGIQAIE